MKILISERIFEIEGRPVNSAHASTLIAVDGGILSAWFGGTDEGKDDVGIWYAKRIDGKWSKPTMLPRNYNTAHWNPVLFRMPDGCIWLFYKIGKTIAEWRTYYRISTDEGMSFGEETELVKGDIGGRGPVKNKPILLSDGAVLAPASHEAAISRTDWKCFADRTKDCGKSWVRTEYIDRDKNLPVIQPTLWESAPDTVHMLVRSGGGYIYRSDSCDGGKTWCRLYATELPNNNSGIDCVLSPNGVLALVYNPVSENWGARTPLQIVFSRDNGQSWSEPLVLRAGEGHFAYPSIIYNNDRFCITYTDCRRTICYCEVTY